MKFHLHTNESDKDRIDKQHQILKRFSDMIDLLYTDFENNNDNRFIIQQCLFQIVLSMIIQDSVVKLDEEERKIKINYLASEVKRVAFNWLRDFKKFNNQNKQNH
jgi:hypothetical protein